MILTKFLGLLKLIIYPTTKFRICSLSVSLFIAISRRLRTVMNSPRRHLFHVTLRAVVFFKCESTLAGVGIAS